MLWIFISLEEKNSKNKVPGLVPVNHNKDGWSADPVAFERWSPVDLLSATLGLLKSREMYDWRKLLANVVFPALLGPAMI